MTGNDIVDIKTAATESNWKRSGFLQKIYTDQEQQYIQDAADPGQMVWRLWSMKESAYKIYSRQLGKRFFAPQKLICTLSGETSGQVTINAIPYQTMTSASKDHVYSIARTGDPGHFYSVCFPIPGRQYINQQQFIYENLVSYYAGILQEDKNNFMIGKEKYNIPFLYCKKEKIKIPVSITHHGNYAAFTIN
jgi:phosphopantetheinyl transferase (holo-ACP synthase)